jgi:Fe2+ or Zn2+ uptake regulation protein
VLEGAVLALLIEHHPHPLTVPELVEEMGEAARPSGRTEVERAVEALADAGLLRRQGTALISTPAAVRAAEIELGLP